MEGRRVGKGDGGGRADGRVPVSGEVSIQLRTGRPREVGAKPRPLIVRVADDETRAKMFQNARKLSRNETTKRVLYLPRLHTAAERGRQKGGNGSKRRCGTED